MITHTATHNHAMRSLALRIAALEAIAPLQPALVIVRVVDARRNGCGLLQDDEVRSATCSGLTIQRLPDEAVEQLAYRAAAAAPQGGPGTSAVVMLGYSEFGSGKNT
jgi:hypothetical protein